MITLTMPNRRRVRVPDLEAVVERIHGWCDRHVAAAAPGVNLDVEGAGPAAKCAAERLRRLLRARGLPVRVRLTR
jgi:hypothetical protein